MEMLRLSTALVRHLPSPMVVVKNRRYCWQSSIEPLWSLVLLCGKVEGLDGNRLEKSEVERPNVLFMADCLQSARPAACWCRAAMCTRKVCNGGRY